MPTNSEKQKQSEKEERQKAALEATLFADMLRYFENLAEDVAFVYENTGTILNPESTQAELETILDSHYRRSVDEFHGDIMSDINNELAAIGEPPVDKDNPALVAAILLFISGNVTAAVSLIMGTSKREIVEALVDKELESGAAQAALGARAVSRSRVISVTETQKAVEGAKFVTHETAAEIVNMNSMGAVVAKTLKEWATVGDGKVRPEHADADAQVVPMEEPFIVGGELLMYPGDSSLGASMSNIANCRCNALYETVFVKV